MPGRQDREEDPVRTMWPFRSVLGRIRPTIVLWAVFTAGGIACLAQTTAIPPAELVRRCVRNEIKAAGDTAYFMFRVRKETPRGSQTKLMVETTEAMVGILIAVNDRPLDDAERQAEFARVERFVKDPKELKKKIKQEKEDTDRVTQIMEAMPDALLYEYDGTEEGSPQTTRSGKRLVRLNFRPKPQYDPPSRVEQVLTAMQGHVLVDADKCRFVRIDGTLTRDVGFGWGILGHLDRGGRLLVEQREVTEGHWEIARMDLDFTGKILLFKDLEIKSDETYSDFRPVPSDLSFAQGFALLGKYVDLKSISPFRRPSI
jgi:hypothetical protein